MPTYLIAQASFSSSNPKGMVFIQGREVKIGLKDGLESEGPPFYTSIPSFYLDTALVTVDEFRLFMKINRYITDAEKKGKAPVYNPVSQTWDTIPGANWEYPWGRDSVKAPGNQAVTQVSWKDAKAYASWIKKRLPTEYELELASQIAKNQGISSLDGSFWQWSDTWYSAYDEKSYFKLQLNRQKTLRGGSLMLDSTKPLEFRPSLRTSALPNVFTSTIGFRCAQSVDR